MAQSVEHSELPAFLRGGGAVAGLIGSHDWGSTALGPLDAWPASLKAMVGTILHAPLPAALLIGEDGYAIYNDAYAALIGGRHPKALGAPAREAWPDAAGLSERSLRAGLAGETLSLRDVEVRQRRDGKLRQVWINIDCSPVLGDDGRPLGVLSIVSEATQRVLTERKAAVELERLRSAFEQAPGFVCMLSGPELIVEFTNAAHKQLFGDRNVIGRPYVEAFSDIAGGEGPERMFHVYETGERYVARAELARIPRPDGGYDERLLDLVVEPVTGDDGQIIGLFVEGFDVTAQVRAQELAAETAQRLSAAVSVARLGAFEWNLETGDATLDERARQIFAFPPDAPLQVSDVVARIDPEDMPRIVEETRAANSARLTRRLFEYRIHLPDGAVRNIATVSDVIHGPDGRSLRVMGVFDDVTERRRAEKRQRLLINELNHRVKNTLATVQSIAAQTLRSAQDLHMARDAFEARLVTLAAAHDLLTAESWHGARLTDVVHAAMAPFEATQHVSRSGPTAWLTAQQALALSMALHELATNAAKYGALSCPQGRVAIGWTIDEKRELTLSWTETGGPPVAPPARSGFGSRLLQRSLARELGGAVHFDFAPEGVRCEIRWRLEDALPAPPAMLDAEPRSHAGS